MAGVWDSPPTEAELSGAPGVFDTPPTPEEMAPPPKADTGIPSTLLSAVGRGAWSIPGLVGLDHAKAQAIAEWVSRKVNGEPADLGALTASQRAGEAAREKEHPIVTGLGIGAGAAPWMAVAPQMAPAATLAGRAGQAALTAAAQSAAIEGGVTADRPVGERLGRMGVAATTGAVLGPLAPAAPASSPVGVPVVERGLSEWLAAKAADRAVKATGATKAELGKLRDPAAVGRALLDEPGVQLRSPKAIMETAGEARGGYGREIGATVRAADDAGAGFNLGGFISRAREEILAPLLNDPLQKPTAARVAQYLDDLATARPPGEPISAAEGHAIRKQLDNFLRGVNRAQDPESTFAKAALNDARGAVDDELGATMERAGVGDRWTDANAGFSAMADATKLAKKGVARREGNRSFGFAEQVAGGPGAIVGTLVGGVPGGAAGYVGASLAANTVKRYGNPVAARTLDKLSKVLHTNPQALGEHAARLSVMEAQRGPEGLAAAHYVLSQTSPDYRARWQMAAGDEEDGQ